ncbi:MAG: 5-(carboxyamino)imidazole ribonucleotide synthase [Isosphaera sp.]|nr:5-(carboxyamino)imidazole ribonucleotide synthase [Isosphaera sp.]
MILGCLGGGQLARMLALAAHPLGISLRVRDDLDATPAAPVCDARVGPLRTDADLDSFCAGLHAVTYEFENVDADLADRLALRVPVRPSPAALRTAQDRLLEKRLFTSLGIKTPTYVPVDSLAQLPDAAAVTGLPAVLKTRRLGYDGKGQAVLRSPDDFAPAVSALLSAHGELPPLILESFVPFQRELSIIAARSTSGRTAFYPLIENHHRSGVLRLSIAPAPHAPPELEAAARRAVASVMDATAYVGVLALELFLVGDRLLANEIAPRVHNSGHWTIDASRTSQFENHARAAADLSLGDTAMLAPGSCAAMVNLVGDLPGLPTLAALPGVNTHVYAKAPRPGRKVGHLNLTAPSLAQLVGQLGSLARRNLPGVSIPQARLDELAQA